MNADASIGRSFICLFPLVAAVAIGLVVSVVLVTLRLAGGRKDLFEVSRPLKRILAVGIPLVLCTLGLLGTATLSSGGHAPPPVVAAPLLAGIALSTVAGFGLCRWAFPEWWAHRQHLMNPDGTWRQFDWRRLLRVLGLVLCGTGLLGVLFAARDGHNDSELSVLALFALLVGGVLLLVVLPKAGPRPAGQKPVTFWRFVFSKSGALIFLGGVGVEVLVAVVTHKHDLAKLCGSAFFIGMVWWRWSRLKASLAEPTESSPAVPPLLLTPEPTAVRKEQSGRGRWWVFALLVLAGVPLAAMVAGSQEEGLFSERGVAFGFIAFVVWSVVVSVLSLLVRVVRLIVNHPVATESSPFGVAPLLLTPDPTQLRGDCPTCLYPIPADSPHGLCPRCLIRGAMPSPSSTRLRRGVSPIEPPTAAEVNEFFPHLEVLQLIGAGGMGAVYTARQPALDRVVALKIVQSPRGDDDPVFAERFAREARAMAKLDHPNIVTIHESGEAGGLPFLLMEYVDGVTLREAMANRLLTTVEALAVIPQVCDALDFAHRNGIVHRDIKPENILIDQTGRVKIADFGLAKLADPKNVTLTRTQQAMGTPHYMAPEQWERPNDVDHRADVYALGVVLYELLTGELPLGRFALPSEKGKGDAKLDQVVIRALAKDPNERFQNAGQMKAALSGVKLAAFTPAVPTKRKGFEYKSKGRFLGLPLVHVVAGYDPVTGRKHVARGWIAVADVMAVGGVAVGGVAGFGLVGVGGAVGAGLIAFGGPIAVGALAAVGGNAAGLLFALGGNAASVGLSIGGQAAGKFAIGGQAGGEYVISSTHETPGFGDALAAWVRGFWPW